MRVLIRVGAAAALVAVGYIAGSVGVFQSQFAQAQVDTSAVTKETNEKIKTAYEALVAAKDALKGDGLYNPITDDKTLNTFAIFSGGVDAIADLESGRGVDPETFAALYADLATGPVREDISRDAEGRLTYKNKVIRMYSIARLKQEFAKRRQLAGIDEQ